ncbi:Branched-chain amino acid aminotransferase/4-amino-4-deoxychorismate lyase [Parafrankia irregularis]|uniref:Branched-chain amino acid aminotransferase/4-amino-4-deoxychorismate lyase n=1 Tax=Parafrankia irregularis TaxID=795642 RepID=A0A0S4QL97_9ACTN|nr:MULTISPECIES: aminotransferase class IV [Parafrankia]CUU56353.1 Branched-chain amino acid aminotransferase/4-amino-4-deoxychorismate lyase [Parafrankia irregularis]
METPSPHVEVDARPAGPADLRRLALTNDGHVTTMQVRAGRVRGLELHLRRLDQANQELYGTGLDPDLLRDRIRHALATAPTPTPATPATAAAATATATATQGPERRGDATVRVVVFPGANGAVHVLVSVGAPAEPAVTPLRLSSLCSPRPFPHLKHVGTFGQLHSARLARRRGFDDALLVTADGLVCETTVANIGFLTTGDGTGDAAGGTVAGPATVIWPQAPMLTGVTMTLLDKRLPGSRREPVPLAGLGRFQAAFVVNGRGLAPVGRIDTTTFPAAPAAVAALAQVYAAVPWDDI